MDESQGKKRRAAFVSLRVKLLVGFTLLFTVVFAVVYYWFYEFATQMAMSRLAEDLEILLVGTAAEVDGDEFQTLHTEAVPREDGYTDDPRYWKHVGWLAKMKRVDPRAGFYTYIKGDEPKEVVFVGSSGALSDPPTGVKFLEHYEPRTYVMWQGLEDTTLYMYIYTDPWGSWVSGYTPIKDSKGERVGGLGVDFRADYVVEVQQAIRDRVWIAFGVTYATLLVMVFLISGALTRPIIGLTGAAERIGEGDYEQDLSHLRKERFPDEIGTLAEVFEIMVSKVYQREQTLIRQVEELKIEIDEVKRKEQVSEIVESDFFQDLQAKARTMRRRSRRQEQGAPGEEAS